MTTIAKLGRFNGPVPNPLAFDARGDNRYAYEQGQAAKKSGKSKSDNSYKKLGERNPDLAQAWESGFNS